MKRISFFLVFIFLVISILHAQTFTIFDLYVNTGASSPSSTPKNFIEYNGKMYFSAYNLVNGTELWVSDGTIEGTKLLKDIRSGSASASPEKFIVFNNKLFFVANNGINGVELWITDGTTDGTTLFKDINTGINDSKPADFNILNNKLFFGATDGVNGYELWWSDGTLAGTVLFKDLIAGNTAGYGYSGLDSKRIGGKIIFLVRSLANGEEPWVTDGTVNGTKLLKDIYAGSNSSNSSLFYAAGDSVVYFKATNAASGTELYKTNGTIDGTQLVKDIQSGINSSFPKNFIEYNNKVYFRANDGISGTELWETNGTAEGTKLCVDIEPGSANSDNGYTYQHDEDMYVYNGKIYFSAKQTPFSNELWISDGTLANTIMLKDIETNGGSNLTNFTTYNGKLYFRAYEETNKYQLWRTDGTTIGTEMILNPLNDNFSPLNSTTEYYVFNNALWFKSPYISAKGSELWKFEDNTHSVIQQNELNSDIITLFPNPTSELLKIKALESFNSLKIYTVNGLLINKINDLNDNNLQLDVSSLPTGIYYIQVQFNDKICTERFIKIN